MPGNGRDSRQSRGGAQSSVVWLGERFGARRAGSVRTEGKRGVLVGRAGVVDAFEYEDRRGFDGVYRNTIHLRDGRG